MAQLNGPIEFNGSLSQLTFYRRRDSRTIMVKTKPGPTKKQIQNDPAFARTRKMGTEWKGCTLGVQWIRRALHPLQTARDYNFTGPLSKLLKAVQLMDTTGAYGQRSVGLSRYPHLLEGFSISRETPFDSLLRSPVACRLDKDTGSARVEVPEIITGVNFLPHTAHPYFRVVVSLGVAPDLYATPFGYTPAVPAGSYLPAVASTEWLGVKSGAPQTVLEVCLPYAVEYPSYSLVLSVGILFGTLDVLGNIKAVKYSGSGRIVAVV